MLIHQATASFTRFTCAWTILRQVSLNAQCFQGANVVQRLSSLTFRCAFSIHYLSICIMIFFLLTSFPSIPCGNKFYGSIWEFWTSCVFFYLKSKPKIHLLFCKRKISSGYDCLNWLCILFLCPVYSIYQATPCPWLMANKSTIWSSQLHGIMDQYLILSHVLYLPIVPMDYIHIWLGLMICSHFQLIYFF